jgi:hypothetical protein
VIIIERAVGQQDFSSVDRNGATVGARQVALKHGVDNRGSISVRQIDGASHKLRHIVLEDTVFDAERAATVVQGTSVSIICLVCVEQDTLQLQAPFVSYAATVCVTAVADDAVFEHQRPAFGNGHHSTAGVLEGDAFQYNGLARRETAETRFPVAVHGHLCYNFLRVGEQATLCSQCILGTGAHL